MSTRSRKGPSAPKKDETPPPGRAASEADRPSFWKGQKLTFAVPRPSSADGILSGEVLESPGKGATLLVVRTSEGKKRTIAMDDVLSRVEPGRPPSAQPNQAVAARCDCAAFDTHCAFCMPATYGRRDGRLSSEKPGPQIPRVHPSFTAASAGVPRLSANAPNFQCPIGCDGCRHCCQGAACKGCDWCPTHSFGLAFSTVSAPAQKPASVARDFAAVGNGLLRLGGAAVGAHLDVLRREKAALDQVEALKVQLAERDAEIKRLNDIIGEMSE